MANDWIMFVKKYAKENNLKYNEALKVAGKHYKKKDKVAKVKGTNTPCPKGRKVCKCKADKPQKKANKEKSIPFEDASGKVHYNLSKGEKDKKIKEFLKTLK